MSERGYDSDAQYISTPRHPIYIAEHSSSRPRNETPISARRGREPDLEHAREQPFGLTFDTKGMVYEQSPCYREGVEHQMSWRSRDYEHRRPQVDHESPSILHNADLGSPRGRPSSPCPSACRMRTKERALPVPIRVQETCRPILIRPPKSKRGSFEDSIGRRTHDTGGCTYHNHHVFQQQGYTTSTESLVGCPPQLSVRKRHQRPRREITQDEQSVHLEEMNIHRMLASSGSTSQIQCQKHPLDENQSSSNAGTWNANRYQTFNNPNSMPPIWDTPEAKSLPMEASRTQDLRSPYSSKASVPSAGSDYDEQNFVNFAEGTSANLSSRRPYLPSEHASASATADEANALRSKFTERFASNQSVSSAIFEPPQGANGVSARKLSIGWMTEGRRIGYGYTLVPPDDSSEGHEQICNGSALPESYGSIENSPDCSFAGSINGRCDRHHSPLRDKSNRVPSKKSESNFDISTILQKLNLPRWTGTNFTLGSSNNSDAGSCGSGGSSLLGILSLKKKDQEATVSNVDADNPWEFCSWVRPVQNSGGQQAPQQDIVRSREYTEAQLIEKLAILRRRGGAWATKRKVSEIARSIEKRADRAVARFAASADHFPVVQQKTRVLRLRGPRSTEQPRRIHVGGPTFSTNQIDGLLQPQKPQYRSSERTSSGRNSGGWDSLYEECLEEHSIPE